jgi:hypothetical protein
VNAVLSRCLRVKLLVPSAGGLSSRPFAPDTTDRGRFPPRIRLKASLLGISLGTLEVSGKNGVGRILDLSVPVSWPRTSVAARLLEETERVARIATWSLLQWELPPGETKLRAKARQGGFTEADDGLLQKPLRR